MVVVHAWSVPDLEQSPDASEAVRVALSSDDVPTRGREAALVVIVEFSDFQCPHCARLATTLAAIEEQFPERVRVEFRHYPLDSHEHARGAAEAAVCAAAQGKFWELHDAMFEDQSKLARPDILATAARVGLDADALESCLDEGRSAAVVERDRTLGTEVGVRGTPTFFIDGQRQVGALPEEGLVELVEAALEAADAR